MAIKLTREIVDKVNSTGMSVNAVLEQEFKNELAEMRKDKRLENKSAVKLALIDNGVRGNNKFENLYSTSDDKFLFPAYMADLVETEMAINDIMSYLVTTETEIDAGVVEYPTLDPLSDENKKNLKKSRVAEGGEFPIRKIALGKGTQNLYKKGIQLEITYEAARRTKIDVMSKMLEMVVSDVVQQNVEEATRVLEAGTITALGTTATANTITNEEFLKAVIAYQKQFGYAPTTVIADGDMFESLFLMTYSKNDALGAGEQFSISFPNLMLEDIQVIRGTVSQVSSKNIALMYNKKYALTKYVERGSSLTEYGNNIENQKNNIVVSEVSGFAKVVNCVGKITSA